jgi:hypothetical protein
MSKLRTPWHVTLSSGSENIEDQIVVEPIDEDEGSIRVRAPSMLDTDAEDLAMFCRTVLAILEERNLIEDDDED